MRIGGLRQILESDPDALRERLNGVAGEAQPLFAALNTAGLDDGLVMLLSAGARPTHPIELIHLSVGAHEPRVAQPRHIVALEEGAEAELVERYLNSGRIALLHQYGPGADLRDRRSAPAPSDPDRKPQCLSHCRTLPEPRSREPLPGRQSGAGCGLVAYGDRRPPSGGRGQSATSKGCIWPATAS